MKKGLIIVGMLVNVLFANTTHIDEGIYSAKACDVSMRISNYGKNKHSYELLGLTKSYQGDLLYESERVLFDKLYVQFNPHLKANPTPTPSEQKEAGDEAGEMIYDVDAKIKSKNHFVFHNYGEVLDPYILFEKCDKSLEYHKIEDLKAVEQDIKNKKKLRQI
ncbi:MAG: hypothetical protein K0U38_04985 [Epsilonproteobacteria bacterium]|nr:hypothetical protein [Campylobacterota bacterium]